MNIGIDIKSAIGNKAGIGYYTKSLVEALSKIDKENSYYLFATEKIDWILGDNFHVIIFPYSSYLEKIFWHIRTWWKVQVGGNIDVFLSPNSLTIPMLSFIRRNVILSIMDIVPYKMRRTAEMKIRILFMQMPLALKITRRFLAISHSTKDDLVNYMKVDPSKITVTPLAAHDWCFEETTGDEINRVRRDYGINNDYFLFVSTLEPRKNIPNLIRAYKLFLNKSEKKVDLVIGGKKGWMYEDIFKLVKENNLVDNVIFTDYIPDEDLLPLYKGALAFTFVSWMEGFGLTPLEAMAVGIPVICSNTSSLPEVVGDSAILVDPSNIKEIANAMIKLATDNELRTELIMKGKKQVSKFSWEKTASLTLDVIKEFKSDKNKSN